MSVLELNGRVFDASTTGTLTLTSEGGAATTDVTQGLAKVWAQFEHDPVINQGFNTSSITDNATGDHSIAYTNNMDGTTYAVTTSGTVDDGSYQVFVSVDHDRGGPRAAGVDLNVVSDGGGLTDAELLSFVSHGDLA